jgi:hypothetical protein
LKIPISSARNSSLLARPSVALKRSLICGRLTLTRNLVSTSYWSCSSQPRVTLARPLVSSSYSENWFSRPNSRST